MIISKTPYRISFFGGGTDFPEWFEKNGGCVLAAAINRHCYISCRYLPPFFAHRHRIVYSIIEAVGDVSEIQHPAVREALKFMGIREGMEIHHDGDLPKQTGLGTSSSFAVGILNALHTLRGENAPALQLAREAIRLERELCAENVGYQDQVTAAFGGLNRVNFDPGDRITVTPVRISPARTAELEGRLLLFFTGFSRLSSDIAVDQIRNIPRKTGELKTMKDMVAEGERILVSGGDIDAFGRLMHEGWMLKRSLSAKISNDNIDGVYARALKAGAIGGKLCGAGGGGFVLVFAAPDRHEAVKEALKDLLHVPFGFEPAGSQVIFNHAASVAGKGRRK